MIFVTAMAIGIATGLLRSAFCVALVAVLIGLTFAAAVFASTVFGGFLPLVLAIAGYNVGLANLVVVGLVLRSWKSRSTPERQG